MEVQDGFIVGIYSYCDRWCEVCRFTSRCRVFADMAEHEASRDPSLGALVNAPPRPEDVPPPPPAWLEEMMDELNEISLRPDPDLDRDLRRRDRAAENEPVCRRAKSYCMRVHEWLRKQGHDLSDAPSDPAAVIGWFHTLVPAKIYRAVRGKADEDFFDRDGPADHDGSAKVALIGIDRSIAAWTSLAAIDGTTFIEARGFVNDLTWMRDELERLFPRARAFVRPAFDEPAEVARLIATEGV